LLAPPVAPNLAIPTAIFKEQPSLARRFATLSQPQTFPKAELEAGHTRSGDPPQKAVTATHRDRHILNYHFV